MCRSLINGVVFRDNLSPVLPGSFPRPGNVCFARELAGGTGGLIKSLPPNTLVPCWFLSVSKMLRCLHGVPARFQLLKAVPLPLPGLYRLDWHCLCECLCVCFLFYFLLLYYHHRENGKLQLLVV